MEKQMSSVVEKKPHHSKKHQSLAVAENRIREIADNVTKTGSAVSALAYRLKAVDGYTLHSLTESGLQEMENYRVERDLLETLECQILEYLVEQCLEKKVFMASYILPSAMVGHRPYKIADLQNAIFLRLSARPGLVIEKDLEDPRMLYFSWENAVAPRLQIADK